MNDVTSLSYIPIPQFKKRFLSTLPLKKGVLLLLSFFFSFNTFAQQKYTVSGYIEDVETGEKLIGANVYDGKTFAGTTTNNYGFYSMTLPADSVDLTVSYVGYQTFSQKILLSANLQKDIALSSTVLETVEVKASQAAEPIQESTQMGSVSIPIRQIKSMPTFLGEVDIIKALQLMPGVQSGSEASSGLYVRGGGPDQNLILLDGVPVYNVSHLFGFFSVFNPDAINSVELIKGGFPARYGGRLSSVVDIRMKEGNTKRFGGSASVGLISSKLTLEGPWVKDKSSFIVSGRRTYIDILAQPLISAESDGNVKTGYYFYDLNAKVNYKFSDKDRLYLSAYTGDDDFYYREKDSFEGESDEFKSSLGWGNLTAMLRWNHVITPKLFSNLTLTHSRYKLQISSEYEEKSDDGEDFYELARYFSGIKDWALKLDFDFLPTPNHYIRFGLNGTHHSFEPGAQQFKVQDASEIPLDISVQDDFVKAVELGAYIEDDVKINDKLKANIGLHLSGFSVKDKFYSSLQPRLSARYLLNPNLSLKASYTFMNQYIHLLSSTSALNLPSDLWVPSTAKVKPQESHQIAVGIAQTFKDDFEVSIEGYYKNMENLISYKDGASYLDGTKDWQSKIEAGKGEAYGFEFLVQKKVGKTTGWIGYTLSWSNREFEEINFGEKFPYRYDRRHDLAITVIHRLSPKVEFSANWVYGTGNATTLAVANYPRANLPSLYGAGSLGYGDIQYYGSRNDFRMPSYHRMDINFSFIKEKKVGERRWNLGLYNAYNRKNPFFMYQDYNYETNEKVFKQVSIFPV
ncbi:MAG: TonB-dependent receptor, partial [Chitinophagales bacterium]